MTDADHTIEIEVNTQYLQEQSDPVNGRYAFAYTIGITNLGEETITLVNRHWRITDDNNRVEEVKGPGVIGQQPEIEPGQSFEYSSGAIIGTETGTMEGSYEMVAANGDKFLAPIPAFLLAPPHTIH
ncbi:MAG: Co2+/Mg2+ efflux protein ApaG [Gammaproteobacteria bacterium]|nr:Co2+/Mg2+ efflux protein ApaG [Gammaproteobacteria bacterium]